MFERCTQRRVRHCYRELSVYQKRKSLASADMNHQSGRYMIKMHCCPSGLWSLITFLTKTIYVDGGFKGIDNLRLLKVPLRQVASMVCYALTCSSTAPLDVLR